LSHFAPKAIPKRKDGEIVVVYFILVHKWPERVSRLVHKLYQSRHYFYIHVDVNIEPEWASTFVVLRQEFSGFPNIFVVKHYGNNWGGIGLVYSEFHAFLDMNGLDWNYFINLSESDYTCKSEEEINKYFRDLEGNSMITSEVENQLDTGTLESFYVDCGAQVTRINNFKNSRKIPTWLNPKYL
jgi:hypothetical protein